VMEVLAGGLASVGQLVYTTIPAQSVDRIHAILRC